VCKHLSGDAEKRCRQADHQGVCTIKQNECTFDGSRPCGTLSSGSGCRCFVTTEGHSFCGRTAPLRINDCGCFNNRDCEQRIGPGAKCIQPKGDAGHRFLCGCRGTRSGCMAPCPTLDPVP
jgi:hypothetical protein